MNRVLFAVLSGTMLLASSARLQADEIDTLGAKVSELDARVYDLNAQLRPPADPGPEIADRRLIDAQVLYELKNYESASIILFDVVDKYANSPAYPEALFYLADSLYLKRDYLSSRRFFEKIVETGPSNRRYQESLERLIELSLHTGDYTPVDGYIAKLEAVQGGRQLPSVPYVKGKYYFFRQQYDKALQALAAIGPEHEYYFHAQYFIAAANVGLGGDKLELAMQSFGTILKTPAKNDAQKLIAELAHLGLARVYLDQGQLTAAQDEYGKISPKSDEFNQSLYETAWVSIKGKDFVKARRALDLLLLNAPDSPLAPEVKLLIGSLNVRRGDYGPATDSFTKTREDYEPIRKQLDDELGKTSTNAGYFRDLISKNMVKFDIAAILPSKTVRYVKDEPEVARLTTLLGDLGDLRRSLDDSEEIVRRLEKALTGPGRVNVFPELASARARAVGISNELTDIKKRLGSREAQVIAPVAGGEKNTLDALDRERADLEAKLAHLPEGNSIADRQSAARLAFNEVDKHASELQAEVTGLKDSLAAARKLHDANEANRDKQTVIEPPKVDATAPVPPAPSGSYTERLQQFDARLKELKDQLGGARSHVDQIKDVVLKSGAAKESIEAAFAEVDGLQGGLDRLRKEIEESALTVGIDDADMQQASALKAQYDELLRRQHAVGLVVRSRLGGPERTKAEQIESILERARTVDEKTVAYNGRIDALLDTRLKEMQSTLADEKAHVLAYRETLNGYGGESSEVGGGIVVENFKQVAQRFYNIVVRADVGIIDVAWALKDSTTKETNRLVAERKRELKLLDDEFKEVLKEQP